MKKMDEIMKEMGFNKSSTPDSQKAFLTSLFKIASEQDANRDKLEVLDLSRAPKESVTKEECKALLEHQLSLFDQIDTEKKSS